MKTRTENFLHDYEVVNGRPMPHTHVHYLRIKSGLPKKVNLILGKDSIMEIGANNFLDGGLLSYNFCFDVIESTPYTLFNLVIKSNGVCILNAPVYKLLKLQTPRILTKNTPIEIYINLTTPNFNDSFELILKGSRINE